MVLKNGDVGDKVKHITNLLCASGYLKIATYVFDNEVEQAVKLFQERHLDINGDPLTIDGIVGKNTMFRTFTYSNT